MDLTHGRYVGQVSAHLDEQALGDYSDHGRGCDHHAVHDHLATDDDASGVNFLNITDPRLVPRIATPQLLVVAADDPFWQLRGYAPRARLG